MLSSGKWHYNSERTTPSKNGGLSREPPQYYKLLN